MNRIFTSLLITAAIGLSSVSCSNSSSAIAGINFGNSSSFESNPNSKNVTRSIKISRVNEIQTSSGLNVTYVVSDENKVVITAPEDIQNKITVKSRGNELKLGVTESIRNIHQLAKITVMSPDIISFEASSGSSITLPTAFSPKDGELEVETSSGASISGNGLKTKLLGAETSSGSSISLNVTAESAAFSSSSGSSMSLSGAAKTVSFSASSGSSISAANLKASTGKATASSGASIKCSIKSPTGISKSSGGSVSNR